MRPVRLIFVLALAAGGLGCPFLAGAELPVDTDGGATVESPPLPATNLSAKILTCSDGGIGGTSIRLSWDAADAGSQTGFWVLRHSSGVYAVPFAAIGRVGADTLAYVDSDAQLSVDFNQTQHWRYDYLIIAVNDAGSALPSNDVNVFLTAINCGDQKPSQSCADTCD